MRQRAAEWPGYRPRRRGSHAGPPHGIVQAYRSRTTKPASVSAARIVSMSLFQPQRYARYPRWLTSSTLWRSIVGGGMRRACTITTTGLLCRNSGPGRGLQSIDPGATATRTGHHQKKQYKRFALIRRAVGSTDSAQRSANTASTLLGLPHRECCKSPAGRHSVLARASGNAALDLAQPTNAAAT